MRHGSAVAPLKSSLNPLDQGLQPVLKAALDSLDVELEEELTRYRRQKHRMARQVGYKQHIPTWKPAHRQMRKPAIELPFHTSSPLLERSDSLDGLATTETHGAGQLQQLVRQTEAVNRILRQQRGPSSQVPYSDRLERAHSSTDTQKPETKVNSDETDVWAEGESGSDPVHRSGQKAPKSLTRDHPPPASGMDGGVVDDKLATAQVRSQSPVTSQSFSSEVLDTSEVSLTRSSALMVHPEPSEDSPGFSDMDDSPSDYLESSEELLKSIAEETLNREYEPETTLLDTLLSPLGIGSMLLLLLSTAALGYVVMHPSSLDFLTAQGQSNPEPSAPAANSSAESSSSTFVVPDSPNLAAEEFVDLNVNNLSTLPRSSRRPPVVSALPNSPTDGATSAPTVTASPQLPHVPEGQPSGSTPFGNQPSQPASDSAPLANSEPVLPPSPPSAPVSVAPAPVYEAPAYETPAYEAPAIDYLPPIDYPPEMTTATPSPSSTYYYVVTPYSGDPSLESAREVVPEAYVRNFDTGASVQLGAFSDPSRAEELVQQLESQGIPAQIYHP